MVSSNKLAIEILVQKFSYDSMRVPRLFVDQNLMLGQTISVSESQAHYLIQVLRMSEGNKLRLFNGRDGEWLGKIFSITRRHCSLKICSQKEKQNSEEDLWLIFSPIKRSRIDFVVSKATELGVIRILPVLTDFTNVKRVNIQRLISNTVEAAQQCGRLSVPRVLEPQSLKSLLANWQVDRKLFYCDETGGGSPINKTFNDVKMKNNISSAAILIGPEGGFSSSELELLNKNPNFTAIDLGPRVLRADTAAIAALSCWQAVLGDWSNA